MHRFLGNHLGNFVMARKPSDSSLAKAQISLEALLLFAIFLSMLAIVLAASSQIRGMAQNREDRSVSQQAFNDFSSKLERACALGNGNVRVFTTPGGEAELSQEANGTILFSMLNVSFSADIPCQIGSMPPAPSNTFTIENKDGTIWVS